MIFLLLKSLLPQTNILNLVSFLIKVIRPGKELRANPGQTLTKIYYSGNTLVGVCFQVTVQKFTRKLLHFTVTIVDNARSIPTPTSAPKRYLISYLSLLLCSYQSKWTEHYPLIKLPGQDFHLASVLYTLNRSNLTLRFLY